MWESDNFLVSHRNFDEHLDDWFERSQLIAQHIPICESVLEIGSGRNSMRKLVKCKNFVTADQTASKETDLVLDLNGPLPVNLRFDLVIWSGVLEYINYPEEIFSWIKIVSRGFVGSYAHIESIAMSGNEAATRSANGWRNHLTLVELSRMAMASGFLMKFHESWRNQSIFSGVLALPSRT